MDFLFSRLCLNRHIPKPPFKLFEESEVQDRNSKIIDTIDFYINNLYKDDFDFYKVDFFDPSWQPTDNIIYFIKKYVSKSFSTESGYVNTNDVLNFSFVSLNKKKMKNLFNQMENLPKILKDDENIFSTIRHNSYDDEESYITLRIYLSEADYKEMQC